MATDAEGFLTELPPIPDGEFCIFGTVHAHPQRADALATVYAETTRLAASEPGTVYYCLARDPDDSTIFHMFERYASKEAFEKHNEQPVIEKLLHDGLMRGVKARIVPAPDGGVGGALLKRK